MIGPRWSELGVQNPIWIGMPSSQVPVIERVYVVSAMPLVGKIEALGAAPAVTGTNWRFVRFGFCPRSKRYCGAAPVLVGTIADA
jgi:hypothetical protein